MITALKLWPRLILDIVVEEMAASDVDEVTRFRFRSFISRMHNRNIFTIDPTKSNITKVYTKILVELLDFVSIFVPLSLSTATYIE